MDTNEQIESQRHLYMNYGFMRSRVKVILYMQLLHESLPRFALFYRNTNNHQGYEFINEGVEPKDIHIPSEVNAKLDKGISGLDDLTKLDDYKIRKGNRQQMEKRKAELRQVIETHTRRNATLRAIREELFKMFPGIDDVMGRLVIGMDFLPAFNHRYSDGQVYKIQTTLAMVDSKLFYRGHDLLEAKVSDEHESIEFAIPKRTAQLLREYAFKHNTDDLKGLELCFDKRFRTYLSLQYPGLNLYGTV